MNLKTFTLLTATALIPATTLLADEDARRAEKERAVAELKEREARRAEEKKRDAESRERNAGAIKERLTDLRAQLKNAEAEGLPEEKREQLRRQIGEVEAKLAAVSGKQGHEIPPEFRERAEKIELTSRRIKHVRAAAENLRAAEMPDMAHELMERAESMERDVVHAKEELMAQMKHRDQPKKERGGDENPEMNELRAQNEKLRAELQEMRRAIEELKSQK